jgi:hypothetical protein
VNDQDERHELLGRLETPPEFKDWASNTLPTPGISNGHQTMAEGRGTSEHERLNNLTSPLRGPADTGRLSEGQKKFLSYLPHQCPHPGPQAACTASRWKFKTPSEMGKFWEIRD